MGWTKHKGRWHRCRDSDGFIYPDQSGLLSLPAAPTRAEVVFSDRPEQEAEEIALEARVEAARRALHGGQEEEFAKRVDEIKRALGMHSQTISDTPRPTSSTGGRGAHRT